MNISIKLYKKSPGPISQKSLTTSLKTQLRGFHSQLIEREIFKPWELGDKTNLMNQVHFLTWSESWVFLICLDDSLQRLGGGFLASRHDCSLTNGLNFHQLGLQPGGGHCCFLIGALRNLPQNNGFLLQGIHIELLCRYSPFSANLLLILIQASQPENVKENRNNDSKIYSQKVYLSNKTICFHDIKYKMYVYKIEINF